jgi:hypothetical protein
MGLCLPGRFRCVVWVFGQSVLGPNLTRSIGALGSFCPRRCYRVNDRLAVVEPWASRFAVQLDGRFMQSFPLTGVRHPRSARHRGRADGLVGIAVSVDRRSVFGATYAEQTNFDLRGPVQAVLLPGFPFERFRFRSDQVASLGGRRAKPICAPPACRRRDLVRLRPRLIKSTLHQR